MNKVLFLDRDGTIIRDKNFISLPEDVELLPKAAEGIRLFREMGYKIIVVSNQSGIARGYFTEADCERVNKKVTELLSQEGAIIDGIYYCPHLPDVIVSKYAIDCECRKPKTGMLLKAAREHNADLTKSVVIGDSARDIEAGKAVGAITILLIARGDDTIPPTDCYIAFDLVEAAVWIRTLTQS
ncbi:MAG: hypothetical protein A2W23_03080 [Planctomycetes bacterium RBG_16_43_13]|nr:MAG: hypothetical protein A2W23_03080 [Planctomycetes bacterium RBG_16_43_13]